MACKMHSVQSARPAAVLSSVVARGPREVELECRENDIEFERSQSAEGCDIDVRGEACGPAERLSHTPPHPTQIAVRTIQTARL